MAVASLGPLGAVVVGAPGFGAVVVVVGAVRTSEPDSPGEPCRATTPVNPAAVAPSMVSIRFMSPP